VHAPSPSRTALHGYTATPTTHVTTWGLITDIPLLGGVYHIIGRGTLYYLPIIHTFRTLQKPYCMTTHPCSSYVCLLFFFVSKTDKPQNPTYMSLPATWWLLFTMWSLINMQLRGLQRNDCGYVGHCVAGLMSNDCIPVGVG
jgi:hypothetical protein